MEMGRPQGEPHRRGIRRKVTNAAENVVNSVRVAPQYHIPGVLFGALGSYAGYEAAENKNLLVTTALAGATLVCTLATGWNELSVLAYLHEYKKMKRALNRHGWDERIVEEYMDFYCGKRASRYAAHDTGYIKEFNEYVEARSKQ